MPIYDSDGTSAYQIGKVYDNDGTANCQNGKVYDNDGTASYLIYSAEQALSDLSVSEANYREYNYTATEQSTTAWNLSGFDSVSLSWSFTTTMAWANGNGLWSTTSLYLRLNDGKTILLGSKRGILAAAGSAYADSGAKTIDLSGYTDAQLSNVWLYITLGDMITDNPIGNSDRHDASARITNAIAS